MISWFRKKDLKSVLRDTKKLKIKGVLFKIKKVDMLSYLDGSKILLQIFQTYQTTKNIPDEMSLKKVDAHFKDIFMASVIKPKLVRKQEDDEYAVCVDELFVDRDISTELYEEIMKLTYGKKKIQSVF